MESVLVPKYHIEGVEVYLHALTSLDMSAVSPLGENPLRDCFRREVAENSADLRYHAASSSKFLLTFRHNLP